jgi:hypothetical protein
MGNIKDTVEVVKGLAEAIPVYEDILQPAAREVGRGIQTLSKTIHIALAPIATLVWGYEKISSYVVSSLEQKLQNVPKENNST